MGQQAVPPTPGRLPGGPGQSRGKVEKERQGEEEEKENGRKRKGYIGDLRTKFAHHQQPQLNLEPPLPLSPLPLATTNLLFKAHTLAVYELLLRSAFAHPGKLLPCSTARTHARSLFHAIRAELDAHGIQAPASPLRLGPSCFSWTRLAMPRIACCTLAVVVIALACLCSTLSEHEHGPSKRSHRYQGAQQTPPPVWFTSFSAGSFKRASWSHRLH